MSFDRKSYMAQYNARKNARKYRMAHDYVPAVSSAESAVKAPAFSINERFQFLANMITMVAQGTTPSALITGPGGLGKSYTVIDTLKSLGYVDATILNDESVKAELTYTIIKGFTTPKALYRKLWECNGQLIILDDCDKCLTDPTALNLLKGALDSFEKRYVSWNAEARLGDSEEELPRTFEFTGKVIFISNMAQDRIDQAVRTRAMCVDLEMTNSQMVERMEVIAASDSFLPGVDAIYKEQALAFMKAEASNIGNMSLRTLIMVTKVFASSVDNAYGMAKYIAAR